MKFIFHEFHTCILSMVAYVTIEDYPYVEMEYHGDPELVLPEGEQWSAIDKTKSF